MLEVDAGLLALEYIRQSRKLLVRRNPCKQDFIMSLDILSLIAECLVLSIDFIFLGLKQAKFFLQLP